MDRRGHSIAGTKSMAVPIAASRIPIGIMDVCHISPCFSEAEALSVMANGVSIVASG